MQKTQHNFNKFQSFPFGFDFDFSFYSEGFAVEKWALFFPPPKPGVEISLGFCFVVCQ